MSRKLLSRISSSNFGEETGNRGTAAISFIVNEHTLGLRFRSRLKACLNRMELISNTFSLG